MLQRCSLQLKAGKYSLWWRLVEIFWDFAPFSASVWLSCSHQERVVAAIKICMRGVRSVHWEATSNHFILTQPTKKRSLSVIEFDLYLYFQHPVNCGPHQLLYGSLMRGNSIYTTGQCLFQKKPCMLKLPLYGATLSFCGESTCSASCSASCTGFDTIKLIARSYSANRQLAKTLLPSLLAHTHVWLSQKSLALHVLILLKHWSQW